MISGEIVLALVILLVVVSILLTTCVKNKKSKLSIKPIRKIKYVPKNKTSNIKLGGAELKGAARSNRRVKRLVAEPSDLVEPFKDDRIREKHDSKVSKLQTENVAPMVNLDNHKLSKLHSIGTDIENKPNF